MLHQTPESELFQMDWECYYQCGVWGVVPRLLLPWDDPTLPFTTVLHPWPAMFECDKRNSGSIPSP